MKRHVFGIFIAALSFAIGLAAAVAVATLTTKRAEPKGIWSKADEDGEALKPISTSPYEIARVVNESKRKWDVERLVLTIDLVPTWKELNVPAGGFAACGGGDCEADVARYELNGEPGKEVVLRLNKPSNCSRYLIFKRADGEWRLLGDLEYDFNRYEDSAYHVEHLDDRSWLVIRAQQGSGSGFALYGESWFEVGRDDVREVLSYPAEGSLYPEQDTLGHEFQTEIVSMENAEGRASVTLQFNVTYTTFDGNITREPFRLFDNSQRARYVWDENARSFVFDAKGSNITPEEMNAVAAGEVISKLDVWDVFLKYNCGRILRVAASGGRTKREKWLRGRAEMCDAAPQK